MNDQLLAYDYFIRRWQIRLVIAGMATPLLTFVILLAVFRDKADGLSFVCAGIVAVAFLFPALIIQQLRPSKRSLSSQASQPTTFAEGG